MTSAFVIEDWTLEASDGDQAPPHIHHGGEEAFICISGDLEVVLNGERRRLPPGEHVVIPRGVAHTFASPKGGRVLAVMTPEIAALIEALHTASHEERSSVWKRHNSSLA